jgi:hypothetical protein
VSGANPGRGVQLREGDGKWDRAWFHCLVPVAELVIRPRDGTCGRHASSCRTERAVPQHPHRPPARTRQLDTRHSNAMFRPGKGIIAGSYTRCPPSNSFQKFHPLSWPADNNVIPAKPLARAPSAPRNQSPVSEAAGNLLAPGLGGLGRLGKSSSSSSASTWKWNLEAADECWL